jgi:hypothetical protein
MFPCLSARSAAVSGTCSTQTTMFIDPLLPEAAAGEVRACAEVLAF